MSKGLGQPIAFGCTTFITLGAAASDQIPSRMMKAFVRLFHAVYLRRYFQPRPGGQDEYRRWLFGRCIFSAILLY